MHFCCFSFHNNQTHFWTRHGLETQKAFVTNGRKIGDGCPCFAVPNSDFALLNGLPFGDIHEASLVLTDALIEAARLRLPAKAYGDGAEIDEDQISETKEDDNG